MCWNNYPRSREVFNAWGIRLPAVLQLVRSSVNLSHLLSSRSLLILFRIAFGPNWWQSLDHALEDDIGTPICAPRHCPWEQTSGRDSQPPWCPVVPPPGIHILVNPPPPPPTALLPPSLCLFVSLSFYLSLCLSPCPLPFSLGSFLLWKLAAMSWAPLWRGHMVRNLNLKSHLSEPGWRSFCSCRAFMTAALAIYLVDSSCRKVSWT